MNDLWNYITQLTQTAFQHSNYVSQKLYIFAVFLAWGDALTSIGSAFMAKMIERSRWRGGCGVIL